MCSARAGRNAGSLASEGGLPVGSAAGRATRQHAATHTPPALADCITARTIARQLHTLHCTRRNCVDSKTYSGLTARQIAEGVRNKSFTATEVTRAALERAHRLDPKIKAFVTILDDAALVAARRVDAAIDSGGNIGRLAGVP